MDTIIELFELSRALDKAIEECKKKSIAFAEAERDYKIVLSQTALKMRASDYPVTLIQTTVYGSRKVADARMKRDIAESMYWTANKEYDSLRLKITLLDRQIAREWGVEK